MTLGLVVGKFYPPHRGHKLLIDTARSRCDRLIVIIAHHPSQTIPGELRLSWLREIHPDCDIRLVPDELENDSEQWARWTLNYLGRAPDIVFTSEDYGPVYARLMGCEHAMVDRCRQVVPISATTIRENPQAGLRFVEPCVAAYLVPRIVLIGAESTGKTTLAQMLAAELNAPWVAEYGREYWERKALGWQTTSPTWCSDEFLHIAQEQQRREAEAARQPGVSLLICDTNAFATGTWHERYLGYRDARVDSVGQQDRVALYLLTHVEGAPFIQDGWRDGESVRQWMHRRFEQTLASATAPVVNLTGDLQRRRELAIDAVRRLLSQPCSNR